MTIRSIFSMLTVSAGLFFSGVATAEEKCKPDNPEYELNFGTVAPDGTPWAEQLRSLETRIEPPK